MPSIQKLLVELEFLRIDFFWLTLTKVLVKVTHFQLRKKNCQKYILEKACKMKLSMYIFKYISEPGRKITLSLVLFRCYGRVWMTDWLINVATLFTCENVLKKYLLSIKSLLEKTAKFCLKFHFQKINFQVLSSRKFCWAKCFHYLRKWNRVGKCIRQTKSWEEASKLDNCAKTFFGKFLENWFSPFGSEKLRGSA